MTIKSATISPGDARAVRRVRVVAVPAGHPYVRRVTSGAGVELRPDPPVPGADADVWWPPVALDPAWIARNADGADLLHIHFGTESFASGHLADCVAAAHAAGWPVVFTVHDLTHPQVADQRAYRAQLDELIPIADALITLTPGAADEIRESWHRDALVLAHPSILGDAPAPTAVAVSEELRIGMHLKDLRPGTDAPAAMRALLGAVTLLRERQVHAVAEVRMHRTVRDEAARDEVRAALGDHPHAVLIEQERLPDAVLHTALAGLDACVLPYRAGTHSGWLELCWDLGVPVAAPAHGHFGDQHRGDATATFVPGDAAALADALAALVASAESARPGSLSRAELVEARREERRRTDAATAEAHADLYRALLRARRGSERRA